MEFDPSRKFVRVNKFRDDGYVEFDFAVGEPDLFVEMLMSEQIFADFCRMHAVQIIDAEDPKLSGGGETDWTTWSLRDAVQSRIKMPPLSPTR